ncbi:hypothetical protein HK100_000346 [Physocladia obscura]|uniref:Uncharacterized protein n=1 Tax=Physocladia obscura TaxID=109957 RepID=A0AAD5T003_9FUNG|nr:hypothetical protein HK100_000346 [Physocladia obscura]
MSVFEGRSSKAAMALDSIILNSETGLQVDLQRKRSIAITVARRFSKFASSAASNNARRQSVLLSSKPEPLKLGNQESDEDQKDFINTSNRGSINPKTGSILRNGLDALLNPEVKLRLGKVSRERVLQLWSILRASVVKSNPLIIRLLEASNSAQPYPLSIVQGFQFKYRLKTKYQIKCLILHSRLPWHQPDNFSNDTAVGDGDDTHLGNILADANLIRYKRNKLSKEILAEDQLRSGSQKNSGLKLNSSAENSTSKARIGEDGDFELKKGQRLMKPSTFVCADTSRTIRMWDVARNMQLKPKAIIRLDVEVYEFVYMSRFSMYATCCDSKLIHYHSNLHELITIGSHEIMVWTLMSSYDG